MKKLLLIIMLSALQMGWFWDDENCPKTSLEGPSDGLVAVTTSKSCNPRKVIFCKSGLPRFHSAQLSHENVIYQVECYDGYKPTRTDELIKRANRERGGVHAYLKRLQEKTSQAEWGRSFVKPQSGGLDGLRRQLTERGGPPHEFDSEGLRNLALDRGVPPIIFERALQKFTELRSRGETLRNCFLAGDMTTPRLGTMWVLCFGSPHSITEIPFHFGLGLEGDGSYCRNTVFKSPMRCAKYFSNDAGSCLPMGGLFLTGKASRGRNSVRNFIHLKGLNDFNKNVNRRRIGIHRAVDHGNQPVNPEGVVSQACFVLPAEIPGGLKDLDFSEFHQGKGIALYVYPEPDDIKKIVEGSKDSYWDESCLQDIDKPAWISSSGTSFFDAKAIEKDTFEFIYDYLKQ